MSTDTAFLGRDLTSQGSASGQPLVRVQNLRISFPVDGSLVEVVRGIDFTIRKGETLALVGESGSGKSVSARALVGLAGPRALVTADVLSIAGRNALEFSENDWRQVRGGTVGLVLQDALVSLDPLRRIGQEIGQVLHAHRIVQKSETQQRSAQLLEAVGVPNPEDRLKHYPHQLSGGLRQRALIATGLAAAPSLLIADEPTTALDVSVQAQILTLLEDRKKQGDTLLLISHDLAVVAQLADRIAVLKDGVIVESGETSKVLAKPEHPYTRKLIHAVPSSSTKGYRLSVTENGEVGLRSQLPAKTLDTGRTVLEARDLRKRYRNGRSAHHQAVDNVSFTVSKAGTLGIVGESGSGKTTVARIVLGLVTPDHGEVLLDGLPWSTLKERARRPRRRLVQFVAQDPLSSFDPRYTVSEIVAESLDGSSFSKAQRAQRVGEILDAVQLGKTYLNRRPRELSGGQRQRVSIARALAPQPSLIIADEPVSALDVSVQAQILDLLADLQAEFGTSLLFISHDLGVVHHIADRVLVMKDGTVVEDGPVGPVFHDPQHEYTQRLVGSLPGLLTQ